MRPPRSLLLVLLRLLPWWFLFTSFVTRSQFLRDGVLPLGQVVSFGCFLEVVLVLGIFGLGRSSYSGSGRWFSLSSPSALGWAGFP